LTKEADLFKITSTARDRISEFVSQEIRAMIRAGLSTHVSEIIESALYASFASLIKARHESDQKIAPIDLGDPRNRLKVENMVAIEICRIAARRLENADPGATYVIGVVKKDRPLKKH
jgi:hypothetical protein